MILTSIVVSFPDIAERILGMITAVEYEFVSITLTCDEKTLRQRAKERDNNQSPTFVVLDQTKQIENTIRINTGNRTPEEVVDELYKVLCEPEIKFSAQPGRCS